MKWPFRPHERHTSPCRIVPPPITATARITRRSHHRFLPPQIRLISTCATIMRMQSSGGSVHGPGGKGATRCDPDRPPLRHPLIGGVGGAEAGCGTGAQMQIRHETARRRDNIDDISGSVA